MNSPFAWPGGKQALLKHILPRIPTHTVYVEVFAGSAKLLFAKPPSTSEVINDLNGDVANFFRILKHRPAELAELLEHELVHPERFRELRASTPADELTRALRFIYTTWHSYGAKGEHFAAGNLAELLKGAQRRPLPLIRELLAATTRRLQNVRIEQRPFLAMLTRFDSPETFFYLDPPYVDFGNIARYRALSPQDRVELFSTLAALKGRFLLSFDNHPEIRALAFEHGFKLEEVTTRYGLGSTSASRRRIRELLLSQG